jgi:hypothetical protein
MKKTSFLLAALLYLVSNHHGECQEVKLPKNSLYFELLGNGGLYSINYERELRAKLYGRIGFSTYALTNILGSGSDSKTRITAFPVMITYLSGNGKSHFEISGGMLFGVETETAVSYSIIDLTAFIGYRYQPPGEGFLFRVGITPFYSLDNSADYPDPGYITSAGVSIGYHF